VERREEGRVLLLLQRVEEWIGDERQHTSVVENFSRIVQELLFPESVLRIEERRRDYR
jgi:hypothetical protein